MKLNETPVRTCRNFNINNIKIEDIEVSKKIENFNNVKINGINEKNSIIYEKFQKKLKYGIGEKLENEVNNSSNHSLGVELKENSNIEIEYDFDEKNLKLIDNIEIIANENIKANILIKYKSQTEHECYHNGIIKLRAKENAKFNVIIVNLLNTKSNNFLSIENELGENANINYTIVDFGGKHSITNYYSNLERKIGKKSN